MALKNLIITLGIIIGGLQLLLAQTSATASFTASATIIQPIGITTTANMNFANIDSREGGTVILTPQNTRSTTGRVSLGGEEELSPATFLITGQPGLTFSINIPQFSYTLTNGSEEMIIDNFTSNMENGGLLADGNQTVRIGATLNILANQSPGFYTSPSHMDVTVIYN